MSSLLLFTHTCRLYYCYSRILVTYTIVIMCTNPCLLFTLAYTIAIMSTTSCHYLYSLLAYTIVIHAYFLVAYTVVIMSLPPTWLPILLLMS